ncbi:MAG: M48 family metalloprotease [Rhodoferax sp.]
MIHQRKRLRATGRLLTWGAMVWLLCTPAAWAQGGQGLPALGEELTLSPAAERRLGERIVRELYRDPDYLDDPVLQDYVEQAWQRLREASRDLGELEPGLAQAFAWQVLLGKDRSINAFALPGGYVGVHLGLLARVASRDELAAVLAHELSHITQRHIARSLSRQQAQSPLLVTALLLGMLAASKSTQAGTALIVGGQAVAAQSQLNYSRDMEREADRVGYSVLQQAGYAPQGMVRMFQVLQQSMRLQDNGDYPYLRSHPLTTERIAEAQARAGVEQAQAAAVPDTEALWMAQRAGVLGDTGSDALRAGLDAVADARLGSLPPLRQAQRWYGAALSALLLRDRDRAERAWERLDELSRQLDAVARYHSQLLGAQVAMGAAPQRALERVDAAQALGGRTRAVRMLRAQAQMGLGQALRAGEDLQLWLADHPGDAGVWELLAQCLQQQQRSVAALHARAQASAARMDYAAAIGQLRAAQELVRGGAVAAHQEASIVDARLRQLEQLVREQALER